MSTRGVGVYPSSGAAALAVKAAAYELAVAAITAAETERISAEVTAGERDPDDGSALEVDVSYGYRWPAQWADAVALTAVRVIPLEGTTGPRQRRHMTVQLDMSCTSFRVTHDEQETHDRAFGLLAVVDEAVRADPTLGGAVLWLVLGEVQSDGATVEDDAGDGRITEVVVTFEARVIVSS